MNETPTSGAAITRERYAGITAARAMQMAHKNASLRIEIAESHMSDVFRLIERAAIAGQTRVVVERPEGYEQGAVKALKLRGFSVFHKGAGELVTATRRVRGG